MPFDIVKAIEELPDVHAAGSVDIHNVKQFAQVVGENLHFGEILLDHVVLKHRTELFETQLEISIDV